MQVMIRASDYKYSQIYGKMLFWVFVSGRGGSRNFNHFPSSRAIGGPGGRFASRRPCRREGRHRSSDGCSDDGCLLPAHRSPALSSVRVVAEYHWGCLFVPFLNLLCALTFPLNLVFLVPKRIETFLQFAHYCTLICTSPPPCSCPPEQCWPGIRFPLCSHQLDWSRLPGGDEFGSTQSPKACPPTGLDNGVPFPHTNAAVLPLPSVPNCSTPRKSTVGADCKKKQQHPL